MMSLLPMKYEYIDNFLDVFQQEALIKQIDQAPRIKWKELSGRRLQNWGGIPDAQKGMILEPLPCWLRTVGDQIAKFDARFASPAINHVLINEYCPGQGIMPHEDGPAYEPRVAIVSLLNPILFGIYPHPKSMKEGEFHASKEPVFQLWLKPGSLLIFSDDIYKHYYHGITAVTQDVLKPNCVVNMRIDNEQVIPRERRVSLTLRSVLKVRKNPFLMGRK